MFKCFKCSLRLDPSLVQRTKTIGALTFYLIKNQSKLFLGSFVKKKTKDMYLFGTLNYQLPIWLAKPNINNSPESKVVLE